MREVVSELVLIGNSRDTAEKDKGVINRSPQAERWVSLGMSFGRHSAGNWTIDTKTNRHYPWIEASRSVWY